MRLSAGIEGWGVSGRASLGVNVPLWALAATRSRPSRVTVSFAVETVLRPRKLVTSVLSPGATSTDTRESRPIAAVAASVDTVEFAADVYTLTAPEIILIWLPAVSEETGLRHSKSEPGRIVYSVPS